MATDPLVSCLCVSRSARWGQLQRAILDFQRQTYRNRELIIVVENESDYSALIEDFVAQRTEGFDARVGVFGRPMRQVSEGFIHALCHARGDILAVWDDDNLNHPKRLEVQVQRQLRFPGAMTALSESLYFFHDSDELFAVSFEQPAAQASDRVALSTLMSPRDVFPALEHYYNAHPLTHMVNGLSRVGLKLVTIGNLPCHHLVGVTGNNLRGYDLHRKLVQTQARKSEWLVQKREEITALLDEYVWDGREVSVTGLDAGAFTYKPKQRWGDDLYRVNIRADGVEVVTEAE